MKNRPTTGRTTTARYTAATIRSTVFRPFTWNGTRDYSGGYYKTYDLTALKDSWKKLSPAKGPYQYYCDIAVPDLTERHSPFCSTGLESYAVAVAAGLANAVETRNGALRLFAIRVPTKDIELVLTIFGVGTTSYELTLPVRDWVKMESAIGPNKERLSERWTQGRISEAMLRVYVRKGIITKADFEEICGKKY